jgi:glycosyltransferase involved in cell wall biosynthesis
MKLGVICEGTANAHYRAAFPMRALKRRGHEIVWPNEQFDLPIGTLATCDLVHCYRRMDRLQDLRTLAQHGVAISFDNDDNYAAAEMSNGGEGLAGLRFNRELARRTVAAAKVADLTITTCEPLADYYRAAGIANIAVIGNYLEPEAYGRPARVKHKGTVLGWVASREHSLDIERVPITPALRQLLDERQDVRLMSVGVRFPIRSERYEHIDYVPFPDLPKVMAAFDVGIAPLADTEFNRSRSDVKLKEYGAAGAAWLASPVGPYRKLGEPQGGVLVADQEWATRLGELVENRRKRRRLAKQATRWSRGQTVDAHVDLWETAFADAIERRASSSTRRTRVSA